jgi:hypothetical protein
MFPLLLPYTLKGSGLGDTILLRSDSCIKTWPWRFSCDVLIVYGLKSGEQGSALLRYAQVGSDRVRSPSAQVKAAVTHVRRLNGTSKGNINFESMDILSQRACCESQKRMSSRAEKGCRDHVFSPSQSTDNQEL